MRKWFGILLVTTVLAVAACQPEVTPTPTPEPVADPTEEVVVTVEATEEAVVEATAEPTEEPEVEVEATEEAVVEATVEPTEEPEVEVEATEEAAVEATDAVELVVEATEETEADVEATEEAVIEATEEVEVVVEATEEAVVEVEATEESVVEATAEPTDEAVVEATELEPWVCPEGFEGQTLSVYNWSTYVAEDTISNFEEACGVTVTYSIYGGNEEMIAILRQGNPGYDIAVPTDYAVSLMASEGLLLELNKDNIPNFVNLNPTLLDTAFDPDNTYSVPYQWGTEGISYNVNNVSGPITSWADVWAHQGSVVWIDEPRTMFGVALALLGYDPNSSDPAQISEARDFLIEHGTNVVAIAADDGQASLASGEADIVIEYSGDIFQVIDDCECDDFAYVIPSETAVVWVDNLVIPAGAPNQALAEAFIDYVLHPQVGADISNYTAFASPNQAAIDLGLVDAELLANPGIYPSEETSERLFFIEDNPEGEQLINDAWSEVKILLGR